MDPEVHKSCYAEIAGFASTDRAQFSYAVVDRQSYDNQYFMHAQDEHHTTRWLCAVPCMAFALAKVVYHVAKLVFLELPKSICCAQKSLKMHTFYIARDGEEFIGYFFALLTAHETGRYWIESSSYNKDAYDEFLSSKIKKD